VTDIEIYNIQSNTLGVITQEDGRLLPPCAALRNREGYVLGGEFCLRLACRGRRSSRAWGWQSHPVASPAWPRSPEKKKASKHRINSPILKQQRSMDLLY